MGRHALEAPRALIRPAMACIAGWCAIVLSLPLYFAGLSSTLPVALCLTAVGALLVRLARRLARTGDPSIDVGATAVTLHVSSLFKRDVAIPLDAIAEVIVDVEGARAGVEHLRFPEGGDGGPQRYLYGRFAGTRLLAVRSQQREPDVALVFRQPRRLGVRRAVWLRDPEFPGVAFPAVDAHALAAAFGERARVAEPRPALALDVHDVQVVGSDRRPLTRAERTAGLALAAAAIFGTGLVQRLLEADGAGWSLLASTATFGAAFAGILVIGRRTRLPA